MHLILPATKDLSEHLNRQRAHRKANDAQRGQWFASHRVDIGQCIGGRDLAEQVRVVDNRREEVDRLNECEPIRQQENPRVVEGLSTDKDSGIGSRFERREGAGQVTRTQLGGSTGATRELRQPKDLGAVVRHGT
jgi:hypothetical protein